MAKATFKLTKEALETLFGVKILNMTESNNTLHVTADVPEARVDLDFPHRVPEMELNLTDTDEGIRTMKRSWRWSERPFTETETKYYGDQREAKHKKLAEDKGKKEEEETRKRDEFHKREYEAIKARDGVETAERAKQLRSDLEKKEAAEKKAAGADGAKPVYVDPNANPAKGADADGIKILTGNPAPKSTL